MVTSVLVFDRQCCTWPQELKELISSYQSQREGGRGPAICSSIISTARQCNMDKDCALPPDEADTKEMALDQRDLVVGNVYRKCAPARDTRKCANEGS